MKKTAVLSLTLALTGTFAALAGAQGDPTDHEVEPNDTIDKATPLRLGVPMEGAFADGPDEDWFRVAIPERGPYRLLFRKKKKADLPPVRIEVRNLERPDDSTYTYDMGGELEEYQYFPVFEKGAYALRISEAGEAVKDVGYRLSIAPFPVELAEADRKAALAAIDKAVAYLTKETPATAQGNEVDSVSGLALGALAGGDDVKARADVIEGFVAFFESKLVEQNGTWKGKPVYSWSGALYEHAVITLGLAEAAATGSAHAKALLPKAVEFLLAAQLGPARCEAWGPVAADSPEVGAWRYATTSTDGDISVTGWCAIALTAAAASGVEVPGTREALAGAVDFVKRLGAEGGFCYTTGASPGGNVHEGIGALVFLLNGEEGRSLDVAEDDLDAHLSAWSQIDSGSTYPLYYAYYATRADYLRGGYSWNAWRTTMIQQLLKNQDAQGTWHGFGSETELGGRYAAALGAMILRLSIEQVPAYLKREVRGF
jgi:hypothetical protein